MVTFVTPWLDRKLEAKAFRRVSVIRLIKKAKRLDKINKCFQSFMNS